MRNPQMSPLFASSWAKATPSERAKIIEDLTPKSQLQPGDSFHIQPDGSFLPLKPGAVVPERPVRDNSPR